MKHKVHLLQEQLKSNNNYIQTSNSRQKILPEENPIQGSINNIKPVKGGMKYAEELINFDSEPMDESRTNKCLEKGKYIIFNTIIYVRYARN